MKVLNDIKLEIPQDIGKDFLTKMMGGRLVPKMEELLVDKKAVCIENIAPKAIFKSFDILRVSNDSVYFKSGNIFRGPNISKILKGSESAIIYVCTLGQKTDDIIKQVTSEGDTLSTIIMDTITTSILGLLGEYIGKAIRENGVREAGWASTCAYAPGQYKWTIEEQKEIFSMIDGSIIGVTLNSSFLMLPFKSISGVYGFGPEDRIDKTRIACDLCPRENCIGRK